MFKALTISLLTLSSSLFADNRFYNENEITDNVFIEIYRVLNQIKDQNDKKLDKLDKVLDIIKILNSPWEGETHEAALD